MQRNKPIGVFDSGLGGLTVVKALKRALPREHIVYFGDTARVPYGTKSKESIVSFSKENTEVLLKRKVKCIVVACNSSSSYALNVLEQNYNIPILGVITPGARKAAGVTRNNRIGVIATTATIQSGQYARWIRKFLPRARVFTRNCPLFVPLVEEGWMRKKLTEGIVREYLTPLKQKKIDTLILGCTHYPLLKPVLQKVMGKRVTLIDSAREVALQVRNVLNDEDLLKEKGKGVQRYFVSDKPQEFRKQACGFLGQNIHAVKI